MIPEPLLLRDYLPVVLEPLRHQAEAKRLDFEVEVDPAVPSIETDPQRLRQLLAALTSNAVKFTATGKVSVEVSLLSGNRAAGRGEGEWVQIRVRDTGRGIPQADQDRIFGPFEQTGDPARSQSMTMGSGLGLTVAQRLAGLLHGRLFLEESTPAGSSFCLHLPVRTA